MLAHVVLAFTVMLDPGHGGSNLGAAGVMPSVHEKRLTLAVAKKTAARLRAAGLTVTMTRERDTFLTLRERVRRANASRPDLFVSIHLNASTDRAQRGTEVFVLDPDGASLELRRAGAAARGDAPPGDADGEARAVVAEHALAAARREASRAARLIQDRVCAALADATGATRDQLDRGVRQGALDVLRGVRVPAVLAELAHIDHPVEGREILRPQVQAQLADALAAAILEHAHNQGGLR